METTIYPETLARPFFLRSESGRTASFPTLMKAKYWADQFLPKGDFFTVTTPEDKVLEYQKAWANR